jgi:prophage tail gpP-like protein
MPNVNLNIGALAYGGWEGISINRTLEAVAGSYELKVTERWAGQQSKAQIAPGQAASLAIDGKPVITGHADDVVAEYDDKTHDITITGRDAAGDLIDCSAIPAPGTMGVWFNVPLLTIAKALCDPFRIPVSADVDTGPPLRIFKIELGESVFTALDRLARLRQVLCVSDGEGAIKFTRAASGVAHSAIKLGQNIKKGRSRFSWRERFSDYVVIGQIPGSDLIDPEFSTGMRGTAKDPGVTRYRPKLIMDDLIDASFDLYQKRAQWEAAVRAGRSRRIIETVNGWYDAQGALWQPNDTVEVADDYLASYGSFLVSGVRQTYNDSDGELSELTITPVASFLAQPMGPMADYMAAGVLGGG